MRLLCGLSILVSRLYSFQRVRCHVTGIVLIFCELLVWQVLMNTGFRSKRMETIDQLLYSPEETKPECLERLQQ